MDDVCVENPEGKIFNKNFVEGRYLVQVTNSMLILFLTCGVEFKNLFPKFDCHVSSSFSARATVMNIFRVPLNLIVITLLVQVCLRALRWFSLLFFNQHRSAVIDRLHSHQAVCRYFFI